MSKIEVVADRLKNIVSINGPKFLINEPYSVFVDLLESKSADIQMAEAVFCFLVSKISDDIDESTDVKSLSGIIKTKCGFN